MTAGDTVPVAGGIDEMIVGASETVSAGTEFVSAIWEDEVGEAFGVLGGEVALNVVTVEKLITMMLVESVPVSDWKPADAAKLEDEGPTIGVGTGLVLLSVKNGSEVDEGVAGEAAEASAPVPPEMPDC
jgi:hypothetical protein